MRIIRKHIDNLRPNRLLRGYRMIVKRAKVDIPFGRVYRCLAIMELIVLLLCPWIGIISIPLCILYIMPNYTLSERN